MATSGTIGNTVVSTVKVVEHAVRRCGLPPTSITSESLEIAKDNLFLLLLALANRGLHLWCVNYGYIGLVPNKATYVLPAGTINLLEAYHSTTQRSEGTDVVTATSVTTELADSINIIRIGLRFTSIAASETVTITASDDDITYVPVQVITRTDWQNDLWYWYQLEPSVTKKFFRVETTNAVTVSDFYLANGCYEIKIQQYNRDNYFNLPNRQMLGRPSTNYYFERLIEPQINLWPVPSGEFDQLVFTYHRQVQDIGSLSQSIELPNRWYEAIIWQLAERLCFELPGVAPERVAMVQQMAEKNYIDVSMEETDGAPIRLQPQISAYTR